MSRRSRTGAAGSARPQARPTRRTPFLLIAALVLCALAFSACGDDDGTSAGTSQTTPTTAAADPAQPATTPDDAAAAGACTPTPEGGGKALPCPTQVLEEGEEASVVFTTSEGSFTVELDTERVPVTANSFAYLTQKRFFDGLDFHRVVPGFVIQGGDPNGDGTGGPGYQVVEEPPSDIAYTKGVVAMAKGGADPPGASGSQFFVVSGEDAGLPPEYAYVGKLSKGSSTVAKISALGQEGADGPPRRDVKITRAQLVTG